MKSGCVDAYIHFQPSESHSLHPRELSESTPLPNTGKRLMQSLNISKGQTQKTGNHC